MDRGGADRGGGRGDLERGGGGRTFIGGGEGRFSFVEGGGGSGALEGGGAGDVALGGAGADLETKGRAAERFSMAVVVSCIEADEGVGVGRTGVENAGNQGRREERGGLSKFDTVEVEVVRTDVSGGSFNQALVDSRNRLDRVDPCYVICL